MSNNNDVVMVNLDRPRELRFGHKAMKRLSAFMGKTVEELEGEEFDFEQLEEIFFFGLQRDASDNGETLEIEDMENILDHAESYEYLLGKMTEAMNKSMGKFGGNAPAAGKPQSKPTRNQSRSTGKSR